MNAISNRDYKFDGNIISGSLFHEFIFKPWDWYRKVFLGLDRFEGNMSSRIGDIVHYCAYMADINKKPDVELIKNYLKESMQKFDSYKTFDEYFEDIKLIAETLINDYVLRYKGLEFEKTFKCKFDDETLFCGRIDRIEGAKNNAIIVDYKTHSKSLGIKKIDINHKIQLLFYAFLLKKNGYNPKAIKLIYINRPLGGEISEKTGKRLKYYPPKVQVFEEFISNEDFEFIENQIKLCYDKILLSRERKDLLHIIWHDPRLKKENNYE